MAISEEQRKFVATYKVQPFDMFKSIGMAIEEAKKIRIDGETLEESLVRYVERNLWKFRDPVTYSPLTPALLEAVKKAAEQTKETPEDFLTRAIESQAQRDKRLLRFGINPAEKQ